MIRDLMGNDRSPDELRTMIETLNSAAWAALQDEALLSHFTASRSRVPAYADLLARHAVDGSTIRNIEEFRNRVPHVNKKDYLRQYPMKDLCWDGSIGSFSFSSTSGSTGKPFYFPRTSDCDIEFSVLAERFLRSSSYQSDGPVLVLICFGMGVWIGGMVTYKAFEIAGSRMKGVSVLSPGINKREIFNALLELSPNFSETIIVGYPPFVKDIIDQAPGHGIDLASRRIRIMFAAEAFSETFRDYLCTAAGIQDPLRDTLNIYGSVELGAMAYESPLSVLVRRIAMQDPAVFSSIFGSISKTPTLAQYNPIIASFEWHNGQILISGGGALPLVRYAIGDSGGVFTYDELARRLREHGIDIEAQASAAGIGYVPRLPFVFVYERNDLSTTLYGLQVYPEHIREALLEPDLQTSITGRFTMLTRFDEKQDQHIELNVELHPGVDPSDAIADSVADHVMTALIEKNSEFCELHAHLGDRARPHIVLWANEDPLYFKAGVKQAWVLRQ